MVDYGGKKDKEGGSAYKQELTEKQKKQIGQAFDIFDTEGSGTIEVKDLKVALRGLGIEPLKSEIKKLLHEIKQPVTRDQELGKIKIDFSQFIKIMTIKMNQKDEPAEQSLAFKEFSQDGKTITLESLKAVAQELGETMTDEELEEMLKEANKSAKAGKDFSVSQNEFKFILAKATTHI